MRAADLITDDGTVRPFVVECRRGLTHWQWRASDTWNKWQNSWLPSIEDFSRLKSDMQLIRPESLIIWPEEDGQFTWEDC
jgi:hypothetical protein